MLYIYLGSVILCFCANYTVSSSILKDAENRGYKIKKEKKNISKNILTFIKTLGVASIFPFNLLLTTVMIVKSDELGELVIEDYVKKGKLIKIEDNESIKDEVIKDESTQVISYNVNNEITREQKIEFLKQEYSRLTNENLNEQNIEKTNQKRR